MFIRILNKKVIKSVSSKKHGVMPSNRIIESDSSDDHSNIESNFTQHIVENLKHSYERKNIERDQLIQQWLEKESLFF